MPTPSKALECRGDTETMFNSKEDSQYEGNKDICSAERLMRSGRKVKVREWIQLHSEDVSCSVVVFNGSECVLLGFVVVIALCQSHGN